jgi:5-carboxymethyl-2-hydroxymuconate isomerase
LLGGLPSRRSSWSVAIRKALVELLEDTYSLSVDIRDMDPEAYKKRLKW